MLFVSKMLSESSAWIPDPAASKNLHSFATMLSANFKKTRVSEIYLEGSVELEVGPIRDTVDERLPSSTIDLNLKPLIGVLALAPLKCNKPGLVDPDT